MVYVYSWRDVNKNRWVVTLICIKNIVFHTILAVLLFHLFYQIVPPIHIPLTAKLFYFINQNKSSTEQTKSNKSKMLMLVTESAELKVKGCDFGAFSVTLERCNYLTRSLLTTTIGEPTTPMGVQSYRYSSLSLYCWHRLEKPEKCQTSIIIIV